MAAVAVVVLVGTSCSGGVPGAVDDQFETWKREEPQRYSFTYGRGGMSGDCLMRVVVEDGEVTRAEAVEDRCDYDAAALDIDAVFDQVRGVYSEGDVQVQYNAEYGFPEIVQVDPEPDSIDDEWGFSVRNFRRG